jgi:hypothetical protein
MQISKRLQKCAQELEKMYDVFYSVQEELSRLAQLTDLVDADLLATSALAKEKWRQLYEALLVAAEFQHSEDEQSALAHITDETEKTKIRDVLARKDQSLQKLQLQLSRQCLDLYEKLVSEDASTNTPMQDSIVETKLQYFLDPSDPEYLEDSDNILTERDAISTSILSMDSIIPEITLNRDLAPRNFLDYKSDFMQNQCWLTHDVMEHSYGAPQQQAIGVDGLLRVNQVWVDVIVTRQYLYDLTTGQFVERHR